MEQQSWQIQMIEEAVALADSPQAQWVEDEEVEAWLDSWGMEDEKPVPCVHLLVLDGLRSQRKG